MRPLKCECGTCRTCYKREYARRYRERNPESVRRLAWESYQRHAAKRCADKARDRAENPEKYRQRDKARTVPNPNRDPWKHSVRSSVYKAIKSGRLIPQPCEKCGESPVLSNGTRGVHAHHDDYNDRLNVRWLCFRCHNKAHRKYVHPQAEEQA